MRVAISDALELHNGRHWWEIHQRQVEGREVFTCVAFDPDFPEGFAVNDAPTLRESQAQAELESARTFLWSYDFPPNVLERG